MHQKGLINKIIETTKMTSCNPNHTPAMQAALGSDPEGEDWANEDWNYASIVGMLLYISNNTRPDIAFPSVKWPDLQPNQRYLMPVLSSQS